MTIRENSYFLAHNGVDVFHYGYCSEDTALDSGQPKLEQFRTFEEFNARYFELSGNTLTENEIESLTPTFLNKYGRSTNYFSFREQDLGVQIPAQMYLIRYKLGIAPSDNPTMGEVFQSVDPNVLTYIKKYNGTNYVIVPISFSAKRVVVGEGESAYASSEIEELNQLATMQAQLESNGVYKTFPPPGSTIFTYDELLAFNWDAE
jgi:hypothetical protein